LWKPRCGREALKTYVQKEQVEQGAVRVRIRVPMVEKEATIAGRFIAQLDPTDGRCTHFREYWFEIDGHATAYRGWGE